MLHTGYRLQMALVSSQLQMCHMGHRLLLAILPICRTRRRRRPARMGDEFLMAHMGAPLLLGLMGSILRWDTRLVLMVHCLLELVPREPLQVFIPAQVSLLVLSPLIPGQVAPLRVPRQARLVHCLPALMVPQTQPISLPAQLPIHPRQPRCL
jgi:hypothetical protein